MRNRTITVLALPLALALLAAACGDDGGALISTTAAPTTTDPTVTTHAPIATGGKTVVDAFVKWMAEEYVDEGDPFLDRPALRCIGEGLVADLGLDRLAELGVDADRVPDRETLFGGMDPGERMAAVDLAVSCVGTGGFFALVTEQGVSVDSANCLIGVLQEDEFFRAAVRWTLLGQDPDTEEDLTSQIAAAAAECLTENEQSLLFGTANTTVPTDS